MPDPYWGLLKKSAVDSELIEGAINRLLSAYRYFTTVAVWGMLPKSAVDNETVEEAVDRIVEAHNADETAHLETGQSLQSHKASEIIDHIAESIVNDKLVADTRAYTAIVKIPSYTSVYQMPASLNDDYLFTGKQPSNKTAVEILNKPIDGDDSEYVFSNSPTSDTGYISLIMPAIPAGAKIYKIKVHIRAKILNPTGAGLWNMLDVTVDGNPYDYEFIPTNSWQDFTIEVPVPPYGESSWNEAIWATTQFNISASGGGASTTDDQLAVSKFYIELLVASGADAEDYSFLPDAVAYVNLLGGGSIYIKNGAYDCAWAHMALESNILIEGESLAGVHLTANDLDYNLQIGLDTGPIYSAGTITMTQNSTTVVFAGVTVTSVNTVGKYLLNRASGHYYKIVSWTDSTHIEIGEAYQGQTTASLTYAVIDMKTECYLKNLSMTFEFILQQALNITVENCEFNGSVLRLGYLENLMLVNCDLMGGTFIDTLNNISNSKFTDNTIRNFTSTVMNLTSSSHGNEIIDNLFLDNKGQGLYINGADNIIKDNIVLNCSWTAGLYYSPILLMNNSRYNVVANNVVRNCGAYGIGSQASADYNIVMGNIVLGNAQAGVVNNGAHSITANNIV